MHIKYIKKNSYTNLFFSFLFYIPLTAKLDGNTLAKKKCYFFFQLEVFVDETFFNFGLFSKINDLILVIILI